MRRFARRFCLAARFCMRLGYTWRHAWLSARRDHDLDEHADVGHAGMH